MSGDRGAAHLARACAGVGLLVAILTWVIWRDEPAQRHLDLRFHASAAGALLALLAARLPAGASRPGSGGRPLRLLVVLLLSAWAGGVLSWTVGVEFDRLVRKQAINPWNHFHYYLGAKYFSELGYTDLYDQALAADREGAGAWRAIPKVRDLRRYEVVPADALPRVRSERWTDARWQAFGEDVRAFQPQLDPDSWRRLLRDRGYNATPPWTAIGRVLVRPKPTPEGLALLSLLDPLLLLGAFLVAARVFGGLRSAVAAAFAALYFGNEQHVVGGLFQYDYMAAMVLAISAARAGRGATAGALVVYASMIRIFPGFVVFGLLVWTARRFARTGTIPRFARRFALGFAGACLVGVLLGCLGGRGPAAWPQFIDAISLHSEEHRFGNKRIGLQHAWTHDWSRGVGGWQTKKHRRAGWEGSRPLWVGSALLLAGLWLAAAWRTADEDPAEPMVTALLLVFAGIVLSRYYWTVAALWVLVGGRSRDGPLGGPAGGTVTALLLGWCAAVYAYADRSDAPEFGWYVLANALFGLGAAAVLGARLLPAPRRLPELDGRDGGQRADVGGPALD